MNGNGRAITFVTVYTLSTVYGMYCTLRRVPFYQPIQNKKWEYD